MAYCRWVLPHSASRLCAGARCYEQYCEIRIMGRVLVLSIFLSASMRTGAAYVTIHILQSTTSGCIYKLFN